ncbi:MAG: hypothetical protein K6E19_11120 [Lachnospiraceae bacterium]|nr:hypothetical protein [Lachnospiraceae bacterium]
MTKLRGRTVKYITMICLVFSLIITCTGCSSGKSGESALSQDNADMADYSPRTKEDGSKFRVAYVDYDEYLPASRQLYYILNGLEESGWIKEGSIPFSENDIETKELSTRQMYEELVSADLGDYIEFAEDAFFYLGYDKESRVVNSLKERAGKDIDLVITFGTSAGVLVSSLDLPIPMVDFSATDPVASGIIESSTEGSGNPNVWAQVEASVPLRQLKYYHSIKPFNNLGIIVYGDEIISGVPDIMAASEEVGFSVVKYNIKEQPRETEEELEKYYAMVKREFKMMAREDIDAFFLTLDLVNDMERLPEMIEPLYDKNIPVYVLDDVNNVYNGALLIISAYDFENVGRFVAHAITRILSGDEAGSLPCIYTSAPYICINLDVAERIHYPLNFEFLAICDEIYTERKLD